MKLFDLDSKFMYYANKFADLMGLNVLTLICCLPIVTIGASLTAMYRVLLAIYRDEESYVTRSFFKSFKENFKQATAIWLIYLMVIVVLALDFWLIFKGGLEVHSVIKYGLGFVTIVVAFSLYWVFILQSRYENKVKQTIRNSFVVGVSHFLYSVMMIILSLLPIVAVALWETAVPIVVLFGFTAPGILQTMLFSRVFDRIEGVDRKAEKAARQADDGWTVELEEDAVNAEGVENAGETEAPEAVAESIETEQNATDIGENGQVDGEN